jgi:hypothetical protein
MIGGDDEGGDGGGSVVLDDRAALCGLEFAMMAASRSHSGLKTETVWVSGENARGVGDGDGDGEGVM